MAPRKAVSQELTREMIMDAARELFWEQGYQHVSMRQVAKKLDYSHGALYYHFKNKADLFYALVTQDFALLNEELAKILTQVLDPEKKVKEILMGFIRFGLTHQNHYEIMFLIKDPEVNSFLQEGPNVSYEKFAQALSELTNNRLTIRDIWSIFLSLHGFVSHYCRTNQSYEDVEALAEYHVDFILKGLKHS